MKKFERRLASGETITNAADLDDEMRSRGYTDADFAAWRTQRKAEFLAVSKFKHLPWAERCSKAQEEIARAGGHAAYLQEHGAQP